MPTPPPPPAKEKQTGFSMSHENVYHSGEFFPNLGTVLQPETQTNMQDYINHSEEQEKV